MEPWRGRESERKPAKEPRSGMEAFGIEEKVADSGCGTALCRIGHNMSTLSVMALRLYYFESYSQNTSLPLLFFLFSPRVLCLRLEFTVYFEVNEILDNMENMSFI